MSEAESVSKLTVKTDSLETLCTICISTHTARHSNTERKAYLGQFVQVSHCVELLNLK